jgi:hypothetical protein
MGAGSFQNICCLIDQKRKLTSSIILFDTLIEIQSCNFVPKPLKKFAYEILQKVSYDYNVWADFPVKGRHWRKSTSDRWGTVSFSKIVKTISPESPCKNYSYPNF